ncbi:hypothetical protein DYU05_10050 [Mucilaginibacter terrenus]|uniref:Lipoprotein n=1 Tax=Mucilaginibacter terrenus TaxID=2482727 RepID=A0A3E2NY25_9SPHI|nr:hypothetical protein [Mucilaginibacter terrenus]RFZ85903.1 hypothetical protein DYU05_10050 [Mucilaginibacter terrenus]
MRSNLITSLKVIIAFSLILLLGCNQIDKKVEYRYGDMVITRIDKSSNSYFWFGVVKEGEDKDPDIKINWGGFDGGFRAYLIFESDHVELFREYGFFKVVKANRHITISHKFKHETDDFDNVSAIHWMDSLSGSFKNVRMIQSPPYESELKVNKDNHSEVNAVFLQ